MQKPQPMQQPRRDPFLGRYVIVRCTKAGVHAGVLKDFRGQECFLAESRRLWFWVPAKGKWLSAVANHGLNSEKSRVSEPVPLIYLSELCEIIPCSKAAENSIRTASNA